MRQEKNLITCNYRDVLVCKLPEQSSSFYVQLQKWRLTTFFFKTVTPHTVRHHCWMRQQEAAGKCENCSEIFELHYHTLNGDYNEGQHFIFRLTTEACDFFR